MICAKPIEAFQCQGKCISTVPHGSGNINDTYRLVFEDGKRYTQYILQRVNHHVFKDVPAVMENLCHVIRHQRRKMLESETLDVGRRVMTLIPTLSGKDYFIDADGNFWRMFKTIPRARGVENVENPNQVYEAAKVFGTFQCHLADLPIRLHETIPEFHHTRSRFNTFVQVVEADSCNRAAEVSREIDFVMGCEHMVDEIVDGLASGKIPERVTHNDTKLNNVLLDVSTGEGLCVIDLDTVMPGSVLYDFGDLVRASTSSAPEDEGDESQVQMDLKYFEAIARGYLETASDFLTKQEKDLLAFSGQLISLELGMRFLTDYLAGDAYFKTSRPGQNVDRCRKQFAMAKSMERQLAAMIGIVDQL